MMIHGSVDLCKGKGHSLSFLADDDTLHLWFIESGKTEGGSPFQFEMAYKERCKPYDLYAVLKEAVIKYEQGFIQCCECGRWIRIEDAHHTCPAGCYCDDCYASGLEAEKEYFSYPD